MCFPGTSAVKDPVSNTGDVGLIPGRGTKIPHALRQCSLRAATTEPVSRSQSPHAATKDPP